MRTKNILIEGFEDIQTLFRYLYLNEDHYIRFFNGICWLKIKMSDELLFKCLNENFPQLGYSYRDFTLTEWLSIINQLKDTPSMNKYFENKTKWQEIKLVEEANFGLNAVSIR